MQGIPRIVVAQTILYHHLTWNAPFTRGVPGHQHHTHHPLCPLCTPSMSSATLLSLRLFLCRTILQHFCSLNCQMLTRIFPIHLTFTAPQSGSVVCMKIKTNSLFRKGAPLHHLAVNPFAGPLAIIPITRSHQSLLHAYVAICSYD